MSTSQPTEKQIDAIIEAALEEDSGRGDVTSEALIPVDLTGKATLLVKEKGVLAGIEIAKRVFTHIDPMLQVDILIKDGTAIKPGDISATIEGSVISILEAERTALNFLQRLSGIASLTAEYAAKVKGTDAKIYDTRKTTPGLRALEKYAVRMGGGQNHRMHLGDAVLIKDNHIAALRAMGMSLKDIILKARKNAPAGITIEAEVNSVKEAGEALEAGADIIMLDNMNVKDMRQAVEKAAGKAKIEASGNITLANVRQVAMTGVDMISIGALTHSYKALDISLEMESQTLKLI
ncbi:MAG: nicotinate-nucleotide diphosphorylase (carboxylating) [Chloroflexi bacterium RBG_13_51_52]|nr:MAG: nicotinate-nucleotide diphosphorylase (carboxylating) [Chloroflexi bacterium RBG_13_51_52]